MKFTIKSAISSIPNCQTRVGLITDIERLPGKAFETPLLLICTKGGSVPHLTQEVLQVVSQESHAIQIPLTSVIQCYEGMKEFKHGIAKFAGLKDCLTYCSAQDPAEATPSGYNDKKSISIWSHNGRKQMSASRYLDIMEVFKPDMYATLSDGDTSLKCSRKRSLKSVEVSSNMFNDCLERHMKSDFLKNCGLLGVVEGGYDRGARASSAKSIANSPIIGAVIDGLHNNGEEAETLTFQDVHPVIEESLKHLPDGILRVMHGRWKPSVLLNLIQSGIDMFDSSLVFAVTERGGAFNFKYHMKPTDNLETATDESSSYEGQSFEISLKDKIYFEDLSPIDENCSCLTCKKHTKSYIHHLLNTKELLGPVLLMIHNLHYYVEFFRYIRESAKQGRAVAICDNSVS